MPLWLRGFFGGGFLYGRGLSHSRSACRRRSFQAFERGMRRPLFRFLFCTALTAGHARAADPHFNLKLFLVVGTALSSHPVFRRRLPAALQILLQRGLAIGIRNAFAAL